MVGSCVPYFIKWYAIWMTYSSPPEEYDLTKKNEFFGVTNIKNLFQNVI